MNNSSPNPYASPITKNVVGLETPGTRGRAGLIVGWLGAAGINVIVPALFAMPIVKGALAILGVVLGVITILFIGACVCWWRPSIGLIMMRGGFLFALSQLFPIMQLVAGQFGFIVASRLGGILFYDDFQYLGGFAPTFAATIVTGGILIAGATVLGALLKLVTNRDWWTYSLDE